MTQAQQPQPDHRVPPLQYVTAKILEGYPAALIKQAVEKLYPEESLPADLIITQALNEIHATLAMGVNHFDALALRRCDILYQKLVEVGDYTGALKAAKLQNDIANRHQEKMIKRSAALEVIQLQHDTTPVIVSESQPTPEEPADRDD